MLTAATISILRWTVGSRCALFVLRGFARVGSFWLAVSHACDGCHDSLCDRTGGLDHCSVRGRRCELLHCRLRHVQVSARHALCDSPFVCVGTERCSPLWRRYDDLSQGCSELRSIASAAQQGKLMPEGADMQKKDTSSV